MDLAFSIAETSPFRRGDRLCAAPGLRAELAAAFLGGVILVAYMAAVLASGRVDPSDFAQLFIYYLEAAFSLWASLGAIGLIVLLLRERPRRGQTGSPIRVVWRWLVARWGQDRLSGLLWPPLFFAGLMASFNAFKQMILPLAGFHYDSLLAHADRLLFGGADGWAFFHGMLGSAQASRAFDMLYHGWFLPMSFGVMLCGFGGPASFHLRTRYLLAYLFVWIGLGSVLAFLLPAAGPCFYQHFVGPSAGFADMMHTLRGENALLAVHGSGIATLDYMRHLQAAFGTHQLALGVGISAMPSVHNGLAVLFALAAFRIDRRLGFAMALYAALIWMGSVYLGWHYAVDGLVAAVLVAGVWWLTGRLADWLEQRFPA